MLSLPALRDQQDTQCNLQTAQEYVYRHPGVGTEKLVDRAAEEAGLRLARELGLDNTFIYSLIWLKLPFISMLLGCI